MPGTKRTSVRLQICQHFSHTQIRPPSPYPTDLHVRRELGDGLPGKGVAKAQRHDHCGEEGPGGQQGEAAVPRYLAGVVDVPGGEVRNDN